MSASKVDNLVEQLFKKGGAKKRNSGKNKLEKGGDGITPFLSALALLGTRIANDKRFFNSKFKLAESNIKRKTAKRRYNKGEVTGGDQSTQSISNMMSSLNALSGNASQNISAASPAAVQNQQAPSALTGGRRYSKKRGGNADPAVTSVLSPANHPHQEYFAQPNIQQHQHDVAEHSTPSHVGGKRRSPARPKRSASPKKRASPKKAARRT
jgi:hypothetical protein